MVAVQNIWPDAADAIYRVPTVDVSLSLVLVRIFRNESLYPAERRWHKKSAAPQEGTEKVLTFQIVLSTG